MLILKVANGSVTSNRQQRMPSINTQYSTYSKFMFKVWFYCTWRFLCDSAMEPPRISAYTLHF